MVGATHNGVGVRVASDAKDQGLILK